MVNKQVMEERKGGEGLGEGRTNSHRVLGGVSVQEKGRTGGTLSSGGSLEPHCLRNIFTCICHAGVGCTELPSRRLVEAVTIGPELATPGPGLGVSVNLYSLWASIYRQEA